MSLAFCASLPVNFPILFQCFIIYGLTQPGNEANFDLCFPYHDHFIYNTMQNFFSKFVCSIIIYSLDDLPGALVLKLALQQLHVNYRLTQHAMMHA